MAETVNYRFRLRRRTAASWSSLNEVLLGSEIGHESDTGRIKIGDAVTPWNSLPYFLQIAEQTPYDNTNSGLAATDVQAAIDEVAASSGGGGSDGYKFCENFLRGVLNSTASGSSFVANEWRPVSYTSGVSASSILDAPGVRMRTGSAVNGLVNLFVTGGLRLKPGIETLRVGCRLVFPVLSDGTHSFVFTFGLRRVITGSESHICVANYTHSSNSGNWGLQSTSGGLTTTTNSSVGPAAATWTELEIEIDAAAANVSLYVDGSLAATHTTNIPTVELGLACLLFKTLGATERDVQIARMWIK